MAPHQSQSCSAEEADAGTEEGDEDAAGGGGEGGVGEADAAGEGKAAAGEGKELGREVAAGEAGVGRGTVGEAAICCSIAAIECLRSVLDSRVSRSLSSNDLAWDGEPAIA